LLTLVMRLSGALQQMASWGALGLQRAPTQRWHSPATGTKYPVQMVSSFPPLKNVFVNI
jgi:hypothetical protein